jgi:hypothetical protein
MLKKYSRFLILIGLILFVGMGQSSSFAQSDTAVYFPETGHWVTDAFLQKYNEVPNPDELYGLPLTDARPVEVSVGSPETWVQYFERARFEYQPSNPVGLQVTLSNIGVYLHDNRQPGEVIGTQPGLSACQFFSQSGYQICYAFLDYYQKNGGIQQFGYPISDVELQDGRMVQYFQRARFEWHPDRPSGKRVVLTDVGRQYLDMVEDPLIMQEYSDVTLDMFHHLETWAFVEKAVLGDSEEQTLYVVVKNQNFQAIENAQVTFTLTYGGNQESSFLMPPTDAQGVSQLNFPVAGEPAGVVSVTVTVTYNNTQKQTVTSYRIWW